jgi:hypothetical protein
MKKNLALALCLVMTLTVAGTALAKGDGDGFPDSVSRPSHRAAEVAAKAGRRRPAFLCSPQPAAGVHLLGLERASIYFFGLPDTL